VRVIRYAYCSLFATAVERDMERKKKGEGVYKKYQSSRNGKIGIRDADTKIPF